VAASAVMEDLDLFEYRVGEFDSCMPPFLVEEFGLHPAPERFDDGIVIAVTDAAHRGQEPGFLRPVGERPLCELDPVVAVDDRLRPRLS